MQSSILEEDEIGRLVDHSELISMKGGPSIYKRETEFLTLAAAPKIVLSYIYLLEEIHSSATTIHPPPAELSQSSCLKEVALNQVMPQTTCVQMHWN